MPRTSRMIIDGEKAVYHVMSRPALDGFPNLCVELKSALQGITIDSGIVRAILRIQASSGQRSLWLKIINDLNIYFARNEKKNQSRSNNLLLSRHLNINRIQFFS